MTASIDNVAAQLAALPAGQRAWFWFCPQLSDDQPVLLLQHLKLDARQEALQSQIAQLDVPAGALPLSGVAHSSGDGTLSFGAPLLDAEGLQRLAAWAGRHVSAYPGLARLKGARFIRMSLGGRVIARHTDDALWAALPAPAVPGSLEEAARLLPRVKPGRSYWFWMTDSGPGGRPWLVLGSSKRDSDGALFAQKVAAARAQAAEPGAVVRGVLRAREDGSLVFASPDPVTGASQGVLAALVAACGGQMPQLATSRLAHLVDGQFQRLVSADTEDRDLSALAAALTRIADEKLAFWFTAEDGGRLIVGPDIQAVKALAAGRGAPMAAGSVHRQKGYLLFQARRPAPGFLEALAAWAGAHHTRHSGLRALRGARFVARTKAGDTVDRQRNDPAWASAFGEGE